MSVTVSTAAGASSAAADLAFGVLGAGASFFFPVLRRLARRGDRFARRVGLKPFDISIDRALKTLRLHARIAVVFGAELRALPSDRRDIRRGGKHLFHEGVAPQIDQRRRSSSHLGYELASAMPWVCALERALCQSMRARQYAVRRPAAHHTSRRLSRRRWFLQVSVAGGVSSSRSRRSASLLRANTSFNLHTIRGLSLRRSYGSKGGKLDNVALSRRRKHGFDGHDCTAFPQNSLVPS
jgi:hypothetical protein